MAARARRRSTPTPGRRPRRHVRRAVRHQPRTSSSNGSTGSPTTGKPPRPSNCDTATPPPSTPTRRTTASIPAASTNTSTPSPPPGSTTTTTARRWRSRPPPTTTSTLINHTIQHARLQLGQLDPTPLADDRRRVRARRRRHRHPTQRPPTAHHRRRHRPQPPTLDDHRHHAPTVTSTVSQIDGHDTVHLPVDYVASTSGSATPPPNPATNPTPTRQHHPRHPSDHRPRPVRRHDPRPRRQPRLRHHRHQPSARPATSSNASSPPTAPTPPPHANAANLANTTPATEPRLEPRCQTPTGSTPWPVALPPSPRARHTSDEHRRAFAETARNLDAPSRTGTTLAALRVTTRMSKYTDAAIDDYTTNDEAPTALDTTDSSSPTRPSAGVASPTPRRDFAPTTPRPRRHDAQPLHDQHDTAHQCIQQPRPATRHRRTLHRWTDAATALRPRPPPPSTPWVPGSHRHQAHRHRSTTCSMPLRDARPRRLVQAIEDLAIAAGRLDRGHPPPRSSDPRSTAPTSSATASTSGSMSDGTQCTSIVHAGFSFVRPLAVRHSAARPLRPRSADRASRGRTCRA